jgi:hypothetical protein
MPPPRPFSMRSRARRIAIPINVRRSRRRGCHRTQRDVAQRDLRALMAKLAIDASYRLLLPGPEPLTGSVRGACASARVDRLRPELVNPTPGSSPPRCADLTRIIHAHGDQHLQLGAGGALFSITCGLLRSAHDLAVNSTRPWVSADVGQTAGEPNVEGRSGLRGWHERSH